MTHAIRFHKAGGPEVLVWEEVNVGKPGPGEARNLTATDPLRAAYYREALQHWTLGLARPEAAGAPGRVLTRAQCENLKSLGYLGPDMKCRRASGLPRPRTRWNACTRKKDRREDLGLKICECT